MGRRALEFSRNHPDTSAGYAAALARLEERLSRAQQIATQQMDGLRDVSAAAERKKELRHVLQQAHLVHIAEVGKAAAREEPDLNQKFVFRPGTRAYLAFRTAARGMAAEAQSHKELLVKHGLVDSVLENFLHTLDQFDEAVEQGLEGRRLHVGASAELRSVADEIVQVVRAMDGLTATGSSTPPRRWRPGRASATSRARRVRQPRRSPHRATRRPRRVKFVLPHDPELITPVQRRLSRRR